MMKPSRRFCRRFLLLIPLCGMVVAGRAARQGAPPSERPPAPAQRLTENPSAGGWQWIWATDGWRAPETVFFRHRFPVARRPIAAKLLIVADDIFVAYLNGRAQPVAQGNDWTTVQEIDVTGHLQAGDNLFAVEVRNTDGPGGLLYKFVLTLPGGRTQVVASGKGVRHTRRAPPAWWTAGFDDRQWPAAREYAPGNGGLWGPLRGAPMPDPSRIVRLWDIRAGGAPAQNPYARPRRVGERMLLSANVGSRSEMDILASAGFTLFQTDSDHLSTPLTAPGQWDWAVPQAARKFVRELGLDWCYFPHCAFPPEWYRESVPFTRLQCLEHNQPVQAFSIWDPSWPDFIEQHYAALARAFGTDIPALYVGIHGDYGEAGLMQGGRTAVPGQKEDWERRFGDLHNHPGWWCADPLARASFRDAMLQKYGGLAQLNAAWKRSFASPDEITYPQRPRAEARQEWLDFVTWYHQSVGRAIEMNLRAARRYFPASLLMVPAGFVDEDPRGGNDNSLIVRIAAQYNAAVRSTHSRFRPFAENAATMFGRIGSACRFYNVPFWVEPPGNLTPEQQVERLFEALSQGAVGLFDWAGSAIACREVYYRYGRWLRVERPVVDVAMFYPAEAQKLRPNQGYAPLFAQACAYLRDIANFDIVDDRMIEDGCLARYRILALWEGTMASASTLEKIREWVNAGGVLIAYDFGKVQSFDGSTQWFTEMFGYANELRPAQVTERYVGAIPAQYRIPVAAPEVADFLGGDWLDTEVEDGVARRWAGANVTVRLPVYPERKYVLLIRATVPPEAAGLTRRVLFNGYELGVLSATGDVTYRMLVPEEAVAKGPLATLTIQSQTFPRPGSGGEERTPQRVGVLVHSVQLSEVTVREDAVAPLLKGSLRRELDLRRLYGATGDSWTRRYGNGLTVFFPATRQLLKGYIEVLRRAIYNLDAFEPGRRSALPVDNANDGVYATLCTDKILLYNSRDTPVQKTISIPPEAFAAWRNEVATPVETTWKVEIEPQGMAVISFTPQPQELLFECEKFVDLGATKPAVDPACSPGKGASSVRLSGGAAITTRFAVEVPGNYALYVRAVRNGIPEPVTVLLDGRPVTAVNAKAGDTLLVNVVPLSRGTHTLTLRARPNRDVRADFVLLTNDMTIAGYRFGVRTAPVE
ncbi:MAG: hypothetical protein RMJ43_06315 [Chloroherpetonaceae bacterium]|nr:hypothetical protein [Chthonomonadaceae bacterium]MDW8207432.1 hypothetical protein [Chloroherpetonaceae bacterium]